MASRGESVKQQAETASLPPLPLYFIQAVRLLIAATYGRASTIRTQNYANSTQWTYLVPHKPLIPVVSHALDPRSSVKPHL